MKLAYPVVLIPFEDHSGGYEVKVPDIPNCFSEGRDLADALFMAQDVASLCVLLELEKGHQAPKASPISQIRPPEPDAVVSLVALDMDAYAKKYGTHTVHKSVTLPAWLGTYADKLHINYSQVLRDALEREYEKQYD
jgi:predicted RNase H-like HicB family nuclease